MNSFPTMRLSFSSYQLQVLCERYGLFSSQFDNFLKIEEMNQSWIYWKDSIHNLPE